MTPVAQSRNDTRADGHTTAKRRPEPNLGEIGGVKG